MALIVLENSSIRLVGFEINIKGENLFEVRNSKISFENCTFNTDSLITRPNTGDSSIMIKSSIISLSRVGKLVDLLYKGDRQTRSQDNQATIVI